ncbi:hypothetical protein [Actinokineospora sp. NBRC 105648]|uniref:hypothetical protein n=1 Tax=Actinokineospora sp. NBRC 105648 TaxID=3032206 RepID=UPI0024A19D55|nr:hypothetical protein [Actinokineospora sp. NBRC 105648]GLZ40303.1 hypothetical protein Acsp05_39270 [Actinokineospora sp. NBRC 105648]
MKLKRRWWLWVSAAVVWLGSRLLLAGLNGELRDWLGRELWVKALSISMISLLLVLVFVGLWSEIRRERRREEADKRATPRGGGL